MTRANVKWNEGMLFQGRASSPHPLSIDGDGKAAASPMELVLIALCGCTAYDVVSILRKKRQPFTALEVSAEAERAPEPPRVYTAIHMVYRVSGRVMGKAVEDAVRLSKEKYCSVAAMLGRTARITYQIELIAE